jgi:hypothetical protein
VITGQSVEKTGDLFTMETSPRCSPLVDQLCEDNEGSPSGGNSSQAVSPSVRKSALPGGNASDCNRCAGAFKNLPRSPGGHRPHPLRDVGKHASVSPAYALL